jgi:beta-fructofuranosidase
MVHTNAKVYVNRGKMTVSRRQFLSDAMVLAAASSLAWRVGSFENRGAPSQSSLLADDPRRPQFHLLPAKNWMNDPNGPIFWNGHYHMFYQYNPKGAFWGDLNWGHAISTDLVHWRHLPVALSPTAGGPDADGCFSGSAIDLGDRVAMVYTGVKAVPKSLATLSDGVHNFRETQCLAISDDPTLSRWTKVKFPVIASPPKSLGITGFRDPSAWRSRESYYLTIGSGIRGKGGMVLLYRSKDLRDWEYLHILASGKGNGRTAVNAVEAGDMWECPELFPLGEKHVLIYSTIGKVHWHSGSLDERTMLFHSERSGIADYGSYYAAKTQLDENGNRILWGWIPETRPLEAYREAGWAGVMSLPRRLSLGTDGQLSMRVCPAFSSLRGPTQYARHPRQTDANGTPLRALSLRDCCGEIRCEAEDRRHALGVSIICRSTRAKLFNIAFDPTAATQIMVDGQTLPLATSNQTKLSIQIFVDGSVIESFINDQITYTKRFSYPGDRAPELEVRLTASGPDGVLLSVSQMGAISSDRLTS